VDTFTTTSPHKWVSPASTTRANVLLQRHVLSIMIDKVTVGQDLNPATSSRKVGHLAPLFLANGGATASTGVVDS